MEPISYWLIGGSATDPATRNVGWSLKQAGWTGFVSGLAKPDSIDAGYKRVWLHNPFGVGKDGMSVFQFLHAQAQTPWLTEDFVEAWAPVVASGVEVIAYVGTPLAFAQRTSRALELAVQTAIEPFLSAGCSIGFDYAESIGSDSPAYQVLLYLRSLGTRVYLEPAPLATMPHLWSFDTVIARDYWLQGYQTLRAKYAPAGPSLSGEKIMLLQQAQDAAAALAQAKLAIAAGYAPAVPAGLLKRADVK